MKKWVKKTLILMAAVVLLAGTASMVAYAHSGHHSQPGRAHEYCTETPCYQDNTVCGGSHQTNHHIDSRSGHHSEGGHRGHH